EQNMNIAATLEVGGVINVSQQQDRDQQQRGHRHRVQPRAVARLAMHGHRHAVCGQGRQKPCQRQTRKVLPERGDAVHFFSHLTAAAVAATDATVLTTIATAIASHSWAMRSRCATMPTAAGMKSRLRCGKNAAVNVSRPASSRPRITRYANNSAMPT